MAKCFYSSGTGFHRPYLRGLLTLCVVASAFPLGGCLFRTRTLDRQFSNAPLKTASQKDLIEYVNAQAARIQSLQATVDIDASAADPKNGNRISAAIPSGLSGEQVRLTHEEVPEIEDDSA